MARYQYLTSQEDDRFGALYNDGYYYPFTAHRKLINTSDYLFVVSPEEVEQGKLIYYDGKNKIDPAKLEPFQDSYYYYPVQIDYFFIKIFNFSDGGYDPVLLSNRASFPPYIVTYDRYVIFELGYFDKYDLLPQLKKRVNIQPFKLTELPSSFTVTEPPVEFQVSTLPTGPQEYQNTVDQYTEDYKPYDSYNLSSVNNPENLFTTDYLGDEIKWFKTTSNTGSSGPAKN